MAAMRTKKHEMQGGVAAALQPQPADALLGLIGLYAADERPEKVDLGVGVYRDGNGETPVFLAIKEAERRLHATQRSKAYIGPEGDRAFFRLLAPLIFGDTLAIERLAGFQTPGGTGALRLCADLLARAYPNATIHIGLPSWANHRPIFEAAGLRIAEYRHLDIVSQTIAFDHVLAQLTVATPGDVILLHGCCHNPTGADFSTDQWKQLAQIMAERELVPFIDLAYQGLGDGMAEDRVGVEIVARQCPETFVAYSCDKNFGLYRERVGALFVLSENAAAADVIQSNLLSLARANWSMPPDHGAAATRIVLESDELTALWLKELDEVRQRIKKMRRLLAEQHPTLRFIADHKGMFSMLDLTADQIASLRNDHAIYMAPSGRIAVAGLTEFTVPTLAAALAAVR